MKIRLKLTLLLLWCFLSGCGKPVYEKKLYGGYYLDAFNEYEEMVIGIQIGEQGVGVIPSTIFAVGQNDNFIIAKQHPRNPPGVIDKSTTNYFIIPLHLKVSNSIDRNYFGPLQLEQFEKKKGELSIGNLEFTIVFKELE